MTPEQIKLVKESWAKVFPIKETAAELFYKRLFEEYPEVKQYFKGDMKEQGKNLMTMINSVISMISTAVNGLDNVDALIEPVKGLGKRHVSYGVTKEDYDKVGEVLLWTLEKGLQDAFTAEVKDAWAVVYSAIAEVMIDGAEYELAKSA